MLKIMSVGIATTLLALGAQASDASLKLSMLKSENIICQYQKNLIEEELSNTNHLNSDTLSFLNEVYNSCISEVENILITENNTDKALYTLSSKNLLCTFEKSASESDYSHSQNVGECLSRAEAILNLKLGKY